MEKLCDDRGVMNLNLCTASPKIQLRAVLKSKPATIANKNNMLPVPNRLPPSYVAVLPIIHTYYENQKNSRPAPPAYWSGRVSFPEGIEGSQLEAETEAVEADGGGEEGEGHSGGARQGRGQVQIADFVIPFVGVEKREEAGQHFRKKVG